ncbi:MAG: DNA polymerase I, partial [Candidatus Saccharimonadales bacterium]
DDYEADDIMGTLAMQAAEQGIETCLITSDLDLLQCTGPLTHVYALKKGFSNIELFNPESFFEKYQINVDQFLDLKALKGDSSDNIPGVPGIGEKTGVQLLQKYQTLDGVYENLWEVKDSTRRKLEAGKDSAYMSKKIAEIWYDAPLTLDLKAMDVHDLDRLKLKTLLNKLEFRSLIRGLPEDMRTTELVASDNPALADITPVKLVDYKTSVVGKLDKVLVWQNEEINYLSWDRTTVAVVDTDTLVDVSSGTQLIAHDAKRILKNVLKAGAEVLPTVLHDTEHAAFLLDPLRKSRDLGDLTGIDTADPLMTVAAVWQLYDEQSAKLDSMPKLASVARDIDFALMPVLARMETRGIKLDTEFLGEMNKDLGKDIEATQKEMFELVGSEFNIGSPSQLAEILYGKLALSTIGIKKGKTGFSTGQKELDKLRGQHPIIELIEKFRELTKLQNTYVEALPKLIDDQSRLHTDFRQDVAATGRLSSADPNLQNIPVRTELGRKIREAFVPEKGNVFVSADYSQFELRLAAVLAGDKPMVEDFNSDIDIHAKTASDVYKIPLDQVSKSQRRDAKVINFGVLYGMGPHALAQNTGMSFHDAKTFIDEYFRLRAPIRKYIDATIAHAKREGYVETYFGRRRPTPDVSSSNFIVRAAGERAAANMPIQGTEADLMKMAMLSVEGQLNPSRSATSTSVVRSHAVPNSAPLRASKSSSISSTADEALGWQVLQIHDSILVECPEQNAEKVSELLRDTMENIYPDLGIKLKVDVSSGKNWGEA